MTLECSVRSQERTVSVEEAEEEEEEEEEEERRPLSMLAEKQRQSACSAATTTRGEAASSLRPGSAIDHERVKQATSCGQKKKCFARGKEMRCTGSRATRSCGAEKAGALGGHAARGRYCYRHTLLLQAHAPADAASCVLQDLGQVVQVTDRRACSLCVL
jgi:hypothetical protein